MNRGLSPGSAAAAAGAVFAAGAAFAGDDDKPPAYKIYIDPETGKYTTEDPALNKDEAAVVAASPRAAGNEAGNGTAAFGITTAALVIAVLAGTALWFRRQH